MLIYEERTKRYNHLCPPPGLYRWFDNEQEARAADLNGAPVQTSPTLWRALVELNAVDV